MILPPDRSHVSTEQRNPSTMNLHEMGVNEIVDTIHREDQHVWTAIGNAKTEISAFISACEPLFLNGGRIIYVGAGTSGRLGLLDAAEAPPTFQLEHDRIIALLAGGESTMIKATEDAEDVREGAWERLEQLALTNKDTVLGIAAGGTTPYALGALEFAKKNAGCLTSFLTCSKVPTPAYVDHQLFIDTGPEVLTGSTRMKAGTATKLVLNMISTTIMIRSGRVYENLMVDLQASNLKLRDRASRIVITLTGLSRIEAFNLLDASGGSVKTAIVMHHWELGSKAAEKHLEKCGNRLDNAIKTSPHG